MTGRSNTTHGLSGHRFQARRMTHALVRGDVGMFDDPLRSQSLALTVGCVLAVVGIAACAVLAFFQPQGRLGDSAIVMVRDSGAMYVRIADTLHPVLNTASARLITGASGAPQLVSQSAVDDASGGATLGIPGAPDFVGAPLTADESGWTICETIDSNTSLILGLSGRPRTEEHSALVTVREEGAAATYLLYEGRRAKVDLRLPAVVRAMRLDGVVARPVSRVLLDSLPEAPPIAPPSIAHAGAAGPSLLHGLPVGSVLRTERVDSSELFVVLSDGVQRIGEVTADLIRFTQSHGRRDIAAVEPGALGAVPVVDHLSVAGHPRRGGVTDGPVLCAQWRWSEDTGSTSTEVYTADALPRGRAVALAQADGSGPRIDSIVLPKGRSAYVRAAGVTGDGAHDGPLYLVDDTGVVFGIHDDEAAKRLALSAPVPAPWPVIARLPRGPVLSVEAASVMRDAVSAP
ncbi:type VII secretion protein EccB [Mycobacterium sp. IDR2000157661]|uniref:type VII secretion protein EccB n=1 Tax=Mycobacterium sp. IDR2000157661 TaxID=2867005 RepID=UPI001EEB7EC5|nr:type VII secretion protein EccB [Mycobacterium sp. IDR2000157661]ULE33789.1 type VII secretion protein EccB [Mycobacterium sp. IDR2000157661]